MILDNIGLFLFGSVIAFPALWLGFDAVAGLFTQAKSHFSRR